MRRISRAYHREETGFSVVRGNFKLGKDTLAINPGPSVMCPSDEADLCMITTFCPEAYCFSKRDEKRYPRVFEFRLNQKQYWDEHVKHPKDIIKDFDWLMKKLRVPINWLRLCVSSDMFSHYDWAASDVLAHHMRKRWDVGTYGYCAVPWHPYENLNFVVRGSGHGNSPCGDTIVISHSAPIPRGYVECPMLCDSCLWCKEETYRRIAFRVHATRKMI